MSPLPSAQIDDTSIWVNEPRVTNTSEYTVYTSYRTTDLKEA